VAWQGPHVTDGQHGQRRGQDDRGADGDRTTEPKGDDGRPGEALPDGVEDQ
jgi:hypothetical protein